MKQTAYNQIQDLEIDHEDQWGNLHVRCPVCHGVKKIDGLALHLIKTCEGGDEHHCEWIEKHNWKRRDGSNPHPIPQRI